MTWFRVDDGFYDHPKVAGLSMAARGLWLTCGSYCARYLTDGHITRKQARKLGGTSAQIRDLIGNRMWIVCESHDDCIAFVNWFEFQPTRNSVENRREGEAERKRKWREAKRDKQGERENVPPGQTAGQTAGHVRPVPPDATRTSALPDPTRPDPIKNYGSPTAAASPQQTREREQPQPPSDEFADGTPIPTEPPADASERASLIAVPDDIEIPAAIETAARARGRQLPASPSAQTAVRLHTPPGLPRTVEAALAVEVQRLAADPRVDRADIDDALAEWSRRPGAGPRLLPHLVADAARARATPRPAEQLTKASQRAAATLAAGQELINELREGKL